MPLPVKRALLVTFFAVLCLTGYCASKNGVVRLRRVVIDAGHGGVDPGCLSQDRRLREKNITLDVAMRVGRYIKNDYPEVEVLYTRTRDVQVELNARTDFANKKDADLFISIHVNSAPQSPRANGSETFVMGTNKSSANMAVCKAENSVILLENDYETRYQGFDPSDPESYIFMNLMQNAYFEQSLALAADIQKNLSKGPIKGNRGIKQGGLLVLWRTAMPAVLVELGFISNVGDRRILASESGRDQMARRIADAFGQFKKRYDSNVELDNEGGSAVDSAVRVKEKTDGVWRIQLFAVTKLLKKGDYTLKGVEGAEPIRGGSFYKYCVGSYASPEDARAALKEYRRNFKDCFVVYVENGVIVNR
ncbi:MAG: N-acetylmuramoyl-L-alanine amidase [Bacteroidales bacterium]|nr:N-acetylmuramoyl-L-alanine amidase [Bacteroidales bacterium]MCI2145668.1 N-acetylmuramoyl-L-alanine amidase [Bacteroidales bacterium]